MAEWINLGGSAVAPYYNILRDGAYEFDEFRKITGYADSENTGTVVYRLGSTSQIKAMVGKVIRGYRITTDLSCRAEKVLSAGAILGQGGTSYDGIFLSGASAGYLPLAQSLHNPKNLAFGPVARTFALDPPEGSDPSQSRYWRWEAREPETGPWAEEGWIKYSTDRWSTRYPLRALRQTSRHADSSQPIGYMDASLTDITDNFSTWGGYTLHVAPNTIYDNTGSRDIRTSHKLRLTEFSVLVSARPAWSAAAPAMVGVGMVADVKLEGRAWYPDAPGDPVEGLTVVAGCDGRFLSVSADGASFGPSAITRTDATGAYSFFVRGEKSGTASITVECGNDTIKNLFNPPFLGATTVKVYGAGGVSDDTGDEAEGEPIESTPTDAPPYQGEGSECIVYPALPFIPAVPARFDEVVTRAWDAGANSVEELDGDLSLSFDMQKVVGVVIGLVGARGDVTDHARIPHALYFHQSVGGTPLFNVMEQGKTLTGDTPYTPGVTAFEIRRAGRSVSYRVDDAAVYTSRVPSTGTVLATTAVFASGDTVPGASGGDDGGGGGSGSLSGGSFVADGVNFKLSPCADLSGATTVVMEEIAEYPGTEDSDFPECGGAYNNALIGSYDTAGASLSKESGEWYLDNNDAPGPGTWLLKISVDGAPPMFCDITVDGGI